MTKKEEYLRTYESEALCNEMQELLAMAPAAIIVNSKDIAAQLGVSQEDVLRRFRSGPRETTIEDLAELAAVIGQRFVVSLVPINEDEYPEALKGFLSTLGERR